MRTQVVILCGGFGNRMGKLSNNNPKPMIEIGGKPIIWHLLKYFTEYGHNEFILCLGHLKEKIIDYFDKNPQPDKIIHLVDTGDGNTSKSQRLLQIKNKIKDDNFFLLYGDDIADVDLKDLLDFHKNKNTIATITTVNLKSDFGIIEINSNDTIKNFIEKPILNDIWINAGFALLNKEIFNYLELGELESIVYKRLSENGKISAYKHTGFWHGINTLKDQLYLNKLCIGDKPPWRIWENE